MKATCNPILTIVMPFFNKKEMVSIMIDSILANTFDNWELLAIDDGADNETRNYLKHYERDERIHFIKRNREPKGAQTCRNIGIELAKGKYIVFFDSDDYIQPYCLEQRVQEIEKHPEVDFVIFPSGDFTNGVFSDKTTSCIFGYPIYGDDIKAFARRTLPYVVWNNIYRLSSIKDHKLIWDTNLLSLQDADFNLKSLLSDLTYVYAHSKPDYGYRTSDNTESVSHKIMSSHHQKSHIYAINNFYRNIQKKYNHKYDKYIYEGVLQIYCKMTYGHIDREFANCLISTISKYSPIYAKAFKRQLIISILLSKLIPEKRARQFAMLSFLLKREIRNYIISKRIRNKKTQYYEENIYNNCNI
ncbi:MAG: glycosyltransferase [Prevotella sp.]|nr:glycosyltransferase [Prevotella sp.]